MQEYYLLTFENTHGAIKAENVLKENGVRTTVMPTPTSITKSCGISLRISDVDIEKIKNLIEDEKLIVKAVFFKDSNGFKPAQL